ncbi:MAG: hypothetical protein Q9193_007306, partial [Seirophora villosa]
MSTAVASAPPGPLTQPSTAQDPNPKPTYPTLAPSTHAPIDRNSATSTAASANTPVVIGEGVAQQKSTPDGKRSPSSARHGPPRIIVKKEPPPSPEVPATSRHRPRKLDLSSSTSQSQAQSSSRPSAPLTARESGGLAMMHDVGLACLSPGFQTQDPTMREQLQRSISVRDQQRHIIESRLQKTAKPTEGEAARSSDPNPFAGPMNTPSSKKRPPAGLSIVPPSHEQFANERVIQSAPLHQSFTGRHQPHPMTRHVANQPSNLSNTSHIHHVPATQTNNKLPSISDVFAGDGLGVHRDSRGQNVQ